MLIEELIEVVEVEVEPVEAVEEEVIELTPQQKFSTALRDLAEFYDAHPELTAPQWPSAFTIYSVPKDDLPTYARAFGTCDKVFDEYSYRLVKTFGAGITLETYSSRESVCERVKIGEEVVPAHVVAAKPAEEEKFVEESVREVFEWKCPGSLLAPAAASAAIDPETAAVVETVDDLSF